MVAVRYAALAALVLWIGALLHLVAGDLLAAFATPLACGVVVLLSLVVIKFVGPPPRAFIPRVAIVALMLITTLGATVAHVAAATAAAVNLGLAAILLVWYLYE